MKKIKIVIGANFGDEGKGLITDYFSSQFQKGIVVRFNGGSQAGHTVVTPESIRHVFSHIGSGSLAGLDTYLSKYFIVNPIMFKKEYEGLNKKGFYPNIFIDNTCLVTSPFDMMINQIVEDYRGNNKHGSCGLGINETIKRSAKLPILVKDLYNPKHLAEYLEVIRNEYFYFRLKELGVPNISVEYLNLLQNDNIIINFINDVMFMLHNVSNTEDYILNNYSNIVFEGAQGLLLDQNSSYFPYVTPSNTGLQNVIEIIDNINENIEEMEICYITRNYMTRHGIGNFYTEIAGKPYANIIDMTNISNKYQGSLRFGLLDTDLLENSITKDLDFGKNYTYKKSLAITCLDQVDSNIEYIYNGNKLSTNENLFFDNITNKLKTDKIYLSYGFTRNSIKIR